MRPNDSLLLKALKMLFFTYCGSRAVEPAVRQFHRNQAFEELASQTEWEPLREVMPQLWERVCDLAEKYEEDFGPVREDPSLADPESEKALAGKYQPILMRAFGLDAEEARSLSEDLYPDFLMN